MTNGGGAARINFVELMHSNKRPLEDTSPEIYNDRNKIMGKDNVNQSGAARSTYEKDCDSIDLDKFRVLMEEHTTKISNQIDSLRTELSNRVGALEEEITKLSTENVLLQDRNKALECRVEILENQKSNYGGRILAIEKESRKLNVIFSAPTSDSVSLNEQRINGMIHAQSGIVLENTRMITTKSGKPKVIAKCRTWADKMVIMQMKKKLQLQGDGGAPLQIYADDDLTPIEREAQFVVRQFARRKREEGHDTRVAYMKAKVDNTWFKLNIDNGKMEQLDDFLHKKAD